MRRDAEQPDTFPLLLPPPLLPSTSQTHTSLSHLEKKCSSCFECTFVKTQNWFAISKRLSRAGTIKASRWPFPFTTVGLHFWFLRWQGVALLRNSAFPNKLFTFLRPKIARLEFIHPRLLNLVGRAAHLMPPRSMNFY